jgi:RNA polymerase sigma factor (sigma-70 family)
MNAVLRHLHRAALLQDGGGLPDGHLLERFLSARDEDAFAALVRRHGAMVLAVCRRILGNVHDAEDAFQATFLVLARKAASFSRHQLVGGWLHEVAYRTALKARTVMARRRGREKRACRETTVEAYNPEDDEDMLQLLDRELSKLPDKYRVPLVLCALEGRSRKEVAAQLHIAEGKLSSRLAYAKKLLTQRLARHGSLGMAGTLAALAQGTASAGVPRALVQVTARAALQLVSGQGLAAGVVSAQTVTLTQGVMKAMLLSKLKTAGFLVLATVVGMSVLGSHYGPAVAQSEGPRHDSGAARASQDELEVLRLEVEALRKGLQITREQVKQLQGEVQALKAGKAHTGGADGRTMERGPVLNEKNLDRLPALNEVHSDLGRVLNELGTRNDAPLDRVLNRANPPGGPLAEAEAALKKLLANSSDKEAADALDHALQILRKAASQKTGDEKRKR